MGASRAILGRGAHEPRHRAQIERVIPPSTASVSPVTYAAPAEQKNAAAAAISSGLPLRPPRTSFAAEAAAAPGDPAIEYARSVAIRPGRSVLSVTPSPAT